PDRGGHRSGDRAGAHPPGRPPPHPSARPARPRPGGPARRPPGPRARPGQPARHPPDLPARRPPGRRPRRPPAVLTGTPRPDPTPERIPMNRLRLAPVAALALALLATACGTTEDRSSGVAAADASGGPVTVVDSRGKEITLDAPAR